MRRELTRDAAVEVGDLTPARDISHIEVHVDPLDEHRGARTEDSRHHVEADPVDQAGLEALRHHVRTEDQKVLAVSGVELSVDRRRDVPGHEDALVIVVGRAVGG
ncbi:MAG TPA: hypothetical protein VGG38_16340 [Acidimicrobiales bacterium]|jgi:hypothetical protein